MNTLNKTEVHLATDTGRFAVLFYTGKNHANGWDDLFARIVDVLAKDSVFTFLHWVLVYWTDMKLETAVDQGVFLTVRKAMRTQPDAFVAGVGEMVRFMLDYLITPEFLNNQAKINGVLK